LIEFPTTSGKPAFAGGFGLPPGGNSSFIRCLAAAVPIEAGFMNHDDHVELLRPGIGPVGESPVWADIGAGDGAFTLALAELLGPGATLYTVDRDHRALGRGAERTHQRFPGVEVRPIIADFTRPLDLPPLDGLVMANALHFTRDQEPVARRLRGLLKPGGRCLIVEYNTDRGNRWVPHPFSFDTWAQTAARAGFSETRLIGRRPSRFLGEIYSAVSL
jgi:SAM-dependent methyltransferase